jgi:hypothetical protein
MLYLLETFPRECDIGTGHLHKVAFLASTLAIANVLAHLRSVVNV